MDYLSKTILYIGNTMMARNNNDGKNATISIKWLGKTKQQQKKFPNFYIYTYFFFLRSIV